MCGITGMIGLSNSSLEFRKIVKMTDAIRHRGPDGEGFLITNADEKCNELRSERKDALIISLDHKRQIALGHRRLTILDLHTSANQPMNDITGRYWIVFNGEIYNHASLREELVGLGYKFKTDHSDTEVILNAYNCWGVECLQKFNGMWAFCIWDSTENSFFIARDRAGKKPLYYTTYNNTLYFSSELKALLTNKEIPRELDEKAVYDYLTYLMVPSPSTIFKGIKKLPAAHYLLIKKGGELTVKQYWSPFNNNPYTKETEEEIVLTLRKKLDEAARLRLIADVEVGALLSGGVDSSINLACLSKYSVKPIKAFSVGFKNEGGYKNEFEYAKKVAKQFNAEYNELMLTEKDFLDFFPDMVYYQDEPIADPANIPIYYISKVAKQQGVKVLLGGEGSDELFAGYKLWPISRQFGNLVEGNPSLAKALHFLHRNSPLKNRRKYYYGWYEKVENNQPVFWSGTELRTEKQKRDFLSTDFLNRLGKYDSFSPMKELYDSFDSKTRDKYDWMAAADLQNRLPDLLLARLDRMTMAASVEGRTPFLDVNVIEYAMKIPAHFKNKNNEEKYILKKAFEGILPDEILYRPKDSFSVPLNSLFSGSGYRNTCMEAIRNFNKETNIFSQDFIEKLRVSGNGTEFWNISNLALWYNKFK